MGALRGGGPGESANNKHNIIHNIVDTMMYYTIIHTTM